MAVPSVLFNTAKSVNGQRRSGTAHSIEELDPESAVEKVLSVLMQQTFFQSEDPVWFVL